MDKEKKQLIYDIVFSTLAIISITLTFLDLTNKINLDTNIFLYNIDFAILIIFILDYFIRLFLAKEKKRFFKNNIPDLISIIPFSSMFRVFRIAKLLRLTKLSKVTKLTKLTRLMRMFGVGSRFYKNSQKFLKKNGLIYVLMFNIIIVIVGALAISIVEEYQFSDAVWWSFVTATTVGYGDISPATPAGRVIAGILMIVGIGTIGMLTGNIASFFISNENTSEETKLSDLIKSSTDLTDLEKEEVIHFAEYLINKRGKGDK